MAVVIPNRVQAWLDGLTDKKNAEVAGLILSGVDPTLENLAAFWAELGEDVRAEIAARLESADGLSPE